MRSTLVLAGIATASAAACSTPFNPSTQYYTPRTYTPSNAKSFSIRYASSFKVFNTTVNGVNYITTLSVCGAPLPTPSSLGLGASDVLLSQLSQPLTAAGITSTTYVPYLTVSGLRRRGPGAFSLCMHDPQGPFSLTHPLLFCSPHTNYYTHRTRSSPAT